VMSSAVRLSRCSSVDIDRHSFTGVLPSLWIRSDQYYVIW